MGIKEKAQANPLMAAITTLSALAIAATGIWQGIELGDQLIMSEAESAAIHAEYDIKLAALETDMTEDRKVNECRWLQDKLDDLSYEIYVLDRDEADPDFIQTKRTQLRKFERRYNALGCAAVLDV